MATVKKGPLPDPKTDGVRLLALADELYKRIAPQRFAQENLVSRDLCERIVSALRAAPARCDEPVAWQRLTLNDRLEWASAYANLKQGQSSSMLCEPPGAVDIEAARQAVELVLRAMPQRLAAPPSRLDATTGLLPIATAPHDGSEILLVSLQPQPDDTTYISISNGSWSEQEKLFVLGSKGSCMNSIGDACATHWIPVNWLNTHPALPAREEVRMAIIRKIDEWTGEVLERGFASSWHYGELADAIRALSPSSNGKPTTEI